MQDKFGVRSAKPDTERISQPLREFDSFIAPGSLRKGKLWMNALIAGYVVAIRAWCRRNFQSAARNVATAEATARNGNSFSCFSAAVYFSVPAPTNPPTTTAAARTAIIATATDMAASKRKPSIVRVIRVRRRPWAGKVARVAAASPTRHSCFVIYFRLPFCTDHFMNSGTSRPIFTSGSVATHSRA